MSSVSTSYAESGRVQQKQRTREHLIAAARRLIEQGNTPSVDQVAEAAGISRTTAYRYFRSQDDLLAAAFPEVAARSLLPEPAPQRVEERLSAVITAFIDIVERSDRQQRAMLRLSLGSAAHELPLRQGRAIGWLSEALEPLHAELGASGVRRLAEAMRSACGIEARVWLTDVAGMDPASIRALQLWISQALLDYARAHPPPAVGRRPAKRSRR